MNKIKLVSCLLLLIACSPSGKITISNVNNLDKLEAFDYLYSLPLTRVSIEITAIRHLTIPGPYNTFAEKYLGFRRVPSISKTDWELSDIDLYAFSEPDPEYCFLVKADKKDNIGEELKLLAERGLVIETDEYQTFSQFSPFFGDKPEPFYFPDLSVKPMMEKDPGRVKTKNDSNAQHLDSYHEGYGEDMKSLEEKAEEAANFIYKLRKRRFKLLVAQDEKPVPEGISIETSVRELEELEKEYLSLFIGKVYSDTIQKTIIYTPKVSQQIEREVICQFSDETGIQDGSGGTGTPLIIELESMKTTEMLKNLQLSFSGSSYTDVLLYRIPEKTIVHLYYGSSTLVDGEIEIFQYGPMVSKAL